MDKSPQERLKQAYYDMNMAEIMFNNECEIIFYDFSEKIIGAYRRDTVHRVPTCEQFGRPTSNSIPAIIRSFKAVAKKRINETRKS